MKLNNKLLKSNKYFLHLSGLVLSFSILILLRCESAVELDLPSHDRVLVANCMFHPDSVWKLHASHSLGAFEEGIIKPVEEATVEIWDETRLIVNLNYTDNGIYIADSAKPVADTPYFLKISAPGYKDVSSKGYIPQIVNVDSLTGKIDIVSVSGEMKIANLELLLSFEDPGTLNNYYKMALWVKLNTENHKQVGFLTRETSILEAVKENFSFDPRGEYFNLEMSFSDKLFSGTRKRILLQSQLWLREGERIEEARIIFSNLSEAYYEYAQTLELEWLSQTQVNQEPRNVYHNINDGLGVFAGYNSTVSSITFER